MKKVCATICGEPWAGTRRTWIGSRRFQGFPRNCVASGRRERSIRLATWDIYEFCKDPKHASPKWPQGYWPKKPAPPNAAAWDRSVHALQKDLEAMGKLVTDPQTDLLAPISRGDGQTILREVLLIADHNAYHLGQLVLVRRLLGCWPEN